MYHKKWWKEVMQLYLVLILVIGSIWMPKADWVKAETAGQQVLFLIDSMFETAKVPEYYQGFTQDAKIETYYGSSLTDWLSVEANQQSLSQFD